MDPECGYYGDHCPTTFDNWVYGDPTLSWAANIILGIIAALLLWWVLWFCFVYLRRDLCVDCFTAGNKVRTKYSHRGTPVCDHHYGAREIAGESTYKCSKHGVPYDKHRRSGVTIDICPEGCIFLDDGELADLEAAARASGQSTGMMLGIAIG